VKLRLPSPAMVVAMIALIVALSGTAIAAVDFAANAGAVDGRSAVGPGTSVRHAAGKLVATARKGHNRGRIPGRFLAGVMHGSSHNISAFLHTVDNQPGTPRRILRVPGIGRLQAQCDDVDPTVGTATTRTSINFTGTVAQGVNVSRLLGREIAAGQRPDVFTAPKGQPVPIIASADGLFMTMLQAPAGSVLIIGAARTDRAPGPQAACLIWGTAFSVH
jgi:hypothetical protein